MAYWFRSYRKPLPDPIPNMPEEKTTEWVHDGDFTPLDRVPVATMYHQRSNDPNPCRRHFGLSKIAMMAARQIRDQLVRM